MVIPPVTDVRSMMLKRGKIMQQDGLVNKNYPRKNWASSGHFYKLKKKL